MASFQSPDGQLIDAPDNYDTKTGENLAYKSVIADHPELKPIRVMVDPSNPQQSVVAPLDQLDKAGKLGLIPKEQFDVQQSAKQSEAKVKSGDIGYTPSQAETIPSQFAQGALAEGLPIVQGAISSAFGLGSGDYNTEKQAYQSVLAAQHKAHPISSTLSNIAGGAAAIGATGGSNTLAQVVPRAAAYSGLSAANTDLSTGDTTNIGSDIAKGAGIGALGGAAGVGLSKLASSAINYISPSVKDAFQRGLSSGVNLGEEGTRQAATTEAINIPSKLTNVMETLQKEIGSQKGHIIGAMDDIGGINHEPIVNSIKNAEQQLTSLYHETGFSSQKKAFQEALSALSESEETLTKNPSSAKALDTIKQVLGNDFIYNDSSLVSSNPATKNILNGVRSDIQHYLESSSENLSGVNVGYKDTLDALNAKGLEKIVPNLSDIESLGSEAPSLHAINKFNNLVEYNNNIQSNRFLNPEMKSDLNSMIDSIVDTAKNSKLARTIQNTHTINPLANNAARMKTANMVGSNIAPYYNNLPQSLQNAIQSTPEIGNILSKAVPPVIGSQGQQSIQRQRNGQ